MTTRRGPATFARRWAAYLPHLPAPGLALDLGADSGAFTRAMAALGWRVVAVEAAPLELDHPAVTVVQSRIHPAGILSLAQAGRFDLALALSFLHWQPDWVECFAAIRRVARIALIEVPHLDERGGTYRALYDQVTAAGETIHTEPCWRGRYLRPTVLVRTP